MILELVIFASYRFIIYMFILHNEITLYMLSVMYYQVLVVTISLSCSLCVHYNVYIMFIIISVALPFHQMGAILLFATQP